MVVSGLLLAAESETETLSASNRALLDQYCVICHNQAVVASVAMPRADLDIGSPDPEPCCRAGYRGRAASRFVVAHRSFSEDAAHSSCLPERMIP